MKYIHTITKTVASEEAAKAAEEDLVSEAEEKDMSDLLTNEARDEEDKTEE